METPPGCGTEPAAPGTPGPDTAEPPEPADPPDAEDLPEPPGEEVALGAVTAIDAFSSGPGLTFVPLLMTTSRTVLKDVSVVAVGTCARNCVCWVAVEDTVPTVHEYVPFLPPQP